MVLRSACWAKAVSLSNVMDLRNRGSTRAKTASMAEMVSAAVFPIRRAARVSRGLRSCRTRTDALIRRQDQLVRVDPESFKTELAPARTFGFLPDVPRPHASGSPRGGWLDKVVMVSGSRVRNDGGLRYADEFV